MRLSGTPAAILMAQDQQSRTPTMTDVVASSQESLIRTAVSEAKQATPTTETKQVTPASEPKRTTPTTEITVKTTTYEYQSSRLLMGRPRTPAYRPTTPVFEISRPNPLLFAVSPITVEQERSRTPKSIISDISVKSSEAMLNGDVHPTELPEDKPTQDVDFTTQDVKSNSESDISKVKSSASIADTPSSEPLPSLPVQSNQRSKTPTYEASRLMSSALGSKRPKTPTYGTSLTGASPVGFQRPKTPTLVAQKSQKSSYRGLTPAEYAAYGGIKTYSPAFGITTPITTQEEVKVEERVEATTATEKDYIKEEAITEVPKPKESTKELDKPKTIPSVPTIVVTQASETIATTSMQEKLSSQIVEKTSVIHETKVVSQKELEKPCEKIAKPIEEVAKVSPDVKLPKKDDQDGLKAVRKLFGKAQPAEKKPLVEQKEETKVISETKSEDTKPTPLKTASPDSTISEKKEESTPPAPTEKKEESGALQAEPLLKAMQKPKGLKSKTSGWSRLKKHMVVEQEEPKFPDMGVQKEPTISDKGSEAKAVEVKSAEKPPSESQATDRDSPKATKMWDAVLFQMFSTKENIMAQIEMNKSEEEKKQEKKDEPVEIPSFAHRLPVLLFSPSLMLKSSERPHPGQ
ncbi:hypothetical protein WMY93_012269 [Mugilogobius chulae]|uniref:Uncharacterized protein n=1 Tax=Mugilogobius chulae TaxID=88201 RepID=A0AAW0PH50_9GOBI